VRDTYASVGIAVQAYVEECYVEYSYIFSGIVKSNCPSGVIMYNSGPMK
jgi:hypothetical protein